MVLSGNLRAGEVEIMIYHLKGGMAEDLPEREDPGASKGGANTNN